ncbi:MAG: hypothetical protein H7A38_00205 [Chlamydiales bacterium]|nr:hypothetical protein [Chlamydiales bacterium]
MSIQLEFRGFPNNIIPAVQIFEETDGAPLPREMEEGGTIPEVQGNLLMTASLGEDRVTRTFTRLTLEDKIVIQPKTLNGFQKLINWLFGEVFSRLMITVEKQPNRLVSRAEVTLQQQENLVENPRILTRITTRNVSYEPVERINVYMSGQEEPIMRTDFEGGFGPENISSKFFSSVADTKPYKIKAIVQQNGKCYSGELKVKNPGHLEIQIGKTQTVMHLYKDRDKTELLKSKTLTPTPFTPEQGNHPLV